MKRIYKDEENADHSVIHLMMNSQCTNHCVDCCNLQYDLDTVPVVTVEELKAAKVVLLTGGEPFLIPGLLSFVTSLRKQFENIERLYIYTSGFSMLRARSDWASPAFTLYVDGVNFSPKSYGDEYAIVQLFHNNFHRTLMGNLKSSRFILMDYPGKTTNNEDFIKDLYLDLIEKDPGCKCKFSIEHRDFQKEFQPNGGVWRRVPVFFDNNVV